MSTAVRGEDPELPVDTQPLKLLDRLPAFADGVHWLPGQGSPCGRAAPWPGRL